MKAPYAAQLDLFGGPATPLESSPALPSSETAPLDLPGVVLAGQLDLLEARAVRLAPVAMALQDARFTDALAALRAHPREDALRDALHALMEALGGPPARLSARATEVLHRVQQAAPAAVATAARRGVAAHQARAAERQGPSVAAAGHWLMAARPAEAQRVLQACVDARQDRVRAHCMLGRAAWEAGDTVRARAHFRSAFWHDDDDESAGEALPDPALVSAREEAAGLVPAPVVRWLPLVGVALRFWPLAPCEADNVGIPPALFHAALVRSRTSSRAGRVDVAARREMKTLAPELFARMLEEGMV